VSQRPHVPDAPGLQWRRRVKGWEARWRARPDVIAKGWRPKSVPIWLGEVPTPDEEREIREHCHSLQQEMLVFGRGGIPELVGARPLPAKIEMPSNVYFMSDGEAIKIGFSGAPLLRIKDVRKDRGRDLTLLAQIDGGREKEAALHRRFAHLRISGEWFRSAPELIEFINEIAAQRC